MVDKIMSRYFQKFNRFIVFNILFVYFLSIINSTVVAVFTGATKLERQRAVNGAVYSLPDSECTTDSSIGNSDILNTNNWCQSAKDFLIPFMKNQIWVENKVILNIDSSGLLQAEYSESTGRISINCNNPGNIADAEWLVAETIRIYGEGSAKTKQSQCKASAGNGKDQFHSWFKSSEIGLAMYVRFIVFNVFLTPGYQEMSSNSHFTGKVDLDDIASTYCVGSTCPNGDDLTSGTKYTSINKSPALINGENANGSSTVDSIRNALSCISQIKSTGTQSELAPSNNGNYEHIALGNIPIDGLKGVKATVFDNTSGDDNGIGYYYDDTFRNVGNATVAELNDGTSMGGLNKAVGINGPKKGGPYAKIEIQYKGKSVIAEVGDKGAGDGSGVIDLHRETVRLLGGDPNNWSNGIGAGEEINIFAVPTDTPVTKWDETASTTNSGVNDKLCASNNASSAAGDFIDGFLVYNQYDQKWADKPYGASTISKAGCYPAAMAMIINAFGKKNTDGSQVTPVETAIFSAENDWYSGSGGTSWAMPVPTGEKWGLKGETMGVPTSQQIIDKLDQGYLIAATGRGSKPFTVGGHIIVIRSHKNGNFLIGDSGHKDTSDKEWNPAKIIVDINQAWAFKD